MTMNTPQAVVSKMERCIVTLVIGKEHDAPRYPFIIPMVRDALLSELYYQIRVRAAIKDLIDVADIVDIRLNAPDGPFLGNDDKICDTIRDDEMEKVFAVVNRTESGHRFSIQAASTQTTTPAVMTTPLPISRPRELNLLPTPAIMATPLSISRPWESKKAQAQSTTTSTHELNDFNKYFNLKIYGTSTIARLNNSGQAGNDGTFLASYLGSLSPKNARDCARIEELIGALSEFELGKIKATDLASKALGFENVKLESGKGEVKINNFVTNKDELKLAKGKAQHTPAPVPLGNAKQTHPSGKMSEKSATPFNNAPYDSDEEGDDFLG